MSGLCGWTGFYATENRRLIERMAARLAHFDRVGIATSVTQKSALALAANPNSMDLYQQDGVLVAVFGHIALRDQRLANQAQRGGIAKTIAQVWREKNARMFADLSGAFSLCILDDNANEAVLAIDRMGTHSLSYQVSGNALIFGSSADALLAHPLATSEIDPQALYNYVYFHMVPGPEMIYQGQRRLLPGEYLLYKNGRVAIKKYWEIEFHETQACPFDELKDTFLQVLRTSVREAAAAQDVGAFLSGGTDSSTIAAMLGEVSGQAARTYSIGFEAQGYDEMAYARLAARHFSTRHHEYYVTADDVVAAIPHIAAIFDQPFGNASAVPAFYCAQMAHSDGVTRLLGGDGGDELFGGNERYAKQALFALYDRIPPALRKGILEPLVAYFPGGRHIQPVRKARSYIEQAVVPMPARLETYNLLQRYGHEQVFTPEFLAAANPAWPLDRLAHTWQQTQAKSLINQMLALDLKITLADNDLPKVVKACELAGVEVGFPFLNDEMVAFSARLAPTLKLKGTTLRYFFKEALREILPNEIITKQKHGFGLPFGVWLHQHRPLQTLAADSLTDLKSRKIIRADFIDRLLGQHLGEHAGYHGTMVWVLLMLEQWFLQRQAVSECSEARLRA